jgi:DNA polymerase-1
VLTLTHSLAGEACEIHVPERATDLAGFEAFVVSAAEAGEPIAFDTETSDLDIYRPGHRLRLAQFGTRREAWVLRTDRFGFLASWALDIAPALVCHNAPFDLLTANRHLGESLAALFAKTTDTRILAHLLDPRARSEGGTGQTLEELAAVFVDGEVRGWKKTLADEFRSLGLKKATGYGEISLENRVFLRYAGLDVLTTRRLRDELLPMVREVGLADLSHFEHHLQGLLAELQRRGVRLDVPYTERLLDNLQSESSREARRATRYGVANVNSTKQLSEALLGMGETLREKTPSGAWKVDASVLLALADLDKDWHRIGARDPNPLADSVLRAKRAGKWAVTYAEAFLTLRDERDRVHPSLNSLQARTARMSVSRPPLQQLPSSDWTIRRAFIADPGHLIVASDYSQVEMRVLAALAEEPRMIAAILSGVDLHDFTAGLVFGEGFTKEQRKIAKAVGFGKVYGGGASGIARQTGAAQSAVKAAIDAYDRAYPGIRRYGRRLQRQAEFGVVEVVTPSGRHLPLDRDRLYAATNYVVQSTARDLLAQAIVDLFEAGLGDYLLLPVHDEIVAQAPEADAEEIVREIGRVMESDFYGVPIVSDPEVYGPSWGHGYGAKE